MSSICKITGAEFDKMVERGAFQVLGPRKVELLRGELRIMNPAGPVHEDYIDYLNRWSTSNASAADATIRVQCSFVCDDDRPKPDVLWLKPKRYGKQRPTVADVLLLIEVADSSLVDDLRDKADIYAEAGVFEYWIVDVENSRIHRMSDSDGTTYRSIDIVVPPTQPAPRCKPNATLDLADLFSIMQ